MPSKNKETSTFLTILGLSGAIMSLGLGPLLGPGIVVTLGMSMLILGVGAATQQSPRELGRKVGKVLYPPKDKTS